MLEIYLRAKSPSIRVKPLKRRKIYTYQGRGASQNYIDGSKQSFAAAVPWLKQEFIDAAGIKRGDFKQDGAVLNVSGGIGSRFYLADWGADGLQQIDDFIFNGGVYTGWCAGGTPLFPLTEFALGTPEEKIGNGINLCGGRAVGPEHPGYDSYSMAGACASPVGWEKGKLSAFFNGGCAFVDLDSNAEVIARYEQSNRAAIVEIKHGQGLAIASGIHIEMPVATLDKTNPHIGAIHAELVANEGERQRLFYHLTRRANL